MAWLARLKQDIAPVSGQTGWHLISVSRFFLYHCLSLIHVSIGFIVGIVRLRFPFFLRLGRYCCMYFVELVIIRPLSKCAISCTSFLTRLGRKVVKAAICYVSSVLFAKQIGSASHLARPAAPVVRCRSLVD